MYKKMVIIILAIGTCLGSNIITNYFDNFEIESNDPSTIDINISIGEIILEEMIINDESYSRINFQNSYQSTKLIGYPNLPMLNQLIEVPHNANIRIEIIEDNTTTYDLINYGITSNIIPIQPSLSKSDNLNNII